MAQADSTFCSIGAGLAFTPVMSNVATYFSKQRSLAVAVSTCGSVLGGICFPLIAQQLLPRVGFPWMMRCIAFVMLFNSCLVLVLARSRTSARKRGPLAELSAFKEPSYLCFAAGTFFNLWGAYVCYYYVRLREPLLRFGFTAQQLTSLADKPLRVCSLGI